MAKKTLPAPTLEYLENLESEILPIYRDQDDQIDRMRAVRELQQPAGLSDDFRIVDVEVRDPTATDEIQRVAAMLGVNPAMLTVTPSSQSEDAIKNGTLREHFSEEVLRVAGSRMPGMDTLLAIIDSVCGDGGGWSKFLFTKDTWDERYRLRENQFEDDREDHDEKKRGPRKTGTQKFDDATEEAKRAAGPPFSWVHVDGRTIYPVPGDNGTFREILEVQERPLLACFRQYRLTVNKDGDIVPDELMQGLPKDAYSVGASCKFVQHADDTWISYYVKAKNVATGTNASRILKQWRHGYGQAPYFYAPGLMMSHWRNRKVGWGVAEAKRWLVEYRSYLWTIHAQLAARDVLTPLFSEMDKDAPSFLGEDGKPKPAQKWNLREIINGTPGQKLYPIAFPATAASLKEQIAMVNEAIEKLESPRVSGQIGGLEGAGFAMSQVLAELKTRHDPIAQSIERMLCDVTRFMWKLVRVKVREKVWVYREGKEAGWLSAGPDDLKDTVGLKWSLDPERPSAKVIEARFWHERLEAGTANKDQAIEAMGDNPDEVRQGQAMDRIRQTPWYIQEYDRAVAQEAGLGELMDRAMALAQTGMPPPGALPAGPGSTGGIVPDMAALAMSPGGAGAAPMNGPMTGVGPGAVVPQQSATPLAQGIVA